MKDQTVQLGQSGTPRCGRDLSWFNVFEMGLNNIPECPDSWVSEHLRISLFVYIFCLFVVVVVVVVVV